MPSALSTPWHTHSGMHLKATQDYTGLQTGRAFSENIAEAPQETWQWGLLIRTPDFVTNKDLAKAIEAIAKAKARKRYGAMREILTPGPPHHPMAGFGGGVAVFNA
jgi:hypothetical protein